MSANVGVIVNTATLPGPGALALNPGATYFVPGQTQRGNPVNPVNVSSLQQFASLYGTAFAAGFLTNDLTMFFGENPGGEAFVIRAPGDAVAASTTFDDGAESPLPTVKFQAGCGNIDPVTTTALGNVTDPGSWGNAVGVQITNSVLSGNFYVIVTYSGVPVEQWGPYPNVAAAVAEINVASSYLLATNLFSDSDGTIANPAPTDTAVMLDGGSDDDGTVTSETLVDALASFIPELGPGYVAVPGYDASLVGEGLIAHGNANGRLAHLSPVQGVDWETAESAAAEFRGSAGSQCGGYFWPWVTIPDGSGGNLVVPPDGFVAGRRSATIAATGVWQPPAGGYGLANYVTGLDPASGVVNDDIGDTLNGEHVNVIRTKAGTRLYGWRSLSTDTVNFELLTQQDILNLVAYQAEQGLQDFVFDLIDSNGQFFSRVTVEVLSILQPFIDAGAFWPGPTNSSGQPSDPGYVIDTGSDINTPQTLAANEALVNIYIRPSPSAELILATVIKAAIGTAF